MLVQHVSLIGRRETNEDQHDIIQKPGVNFFAVYDGHGGYRVSRYLKENLSKLLLKRGVKYPLPKDYINKVADHIQKNLATATEVGSTCLAVINYTVENKQFLQILNSGDCRAVMCTNNMAYPLTKDHKPNWHDERKRIEALGGHIYQDEYGDHRITDLSVSRAFGDMSSAPYVHHRPEIHHYKIGHNDKFMVIACDGVWDVLQNHEVVNFILDRVEFVEKPNPQPNESKYQVRLIDGRCNIAKNLAEYAIAKGSGDNITAIVVFL